MRSRPPCGGASVFARSASAFDPARITGGGPPERPAPAARTAKCSSIWAKTPAAPIARRAAAAVNGSKSGTMSSCSIIKTLPGRIFRFRANASTRGWAWSAPSRYLPEKNPSTIPKSSSRSSARLRRRPAAAFTTAKTAKKTARRASSPTTSAQQRSFSATPRRLPPPTWAQAMCCAALHAAPCVMGANSALKARSSPRSPARSSPK